MNAYKERHIKYIVNILLCSSTFYAILFNKELILYLINNIYYIYYLICFINNKE